MNYNCKPANSSSLPRVPHTYRPEEEAADPARDSRSDAQALARSLQSPRLTDASYCGAETPPVSSTFVWPKKKFSFCSPSAPERAACPAPLWAGSHRSLLSRTSPFINHILHSEHASPLPCHFCFQITISLINQGKCIISDCLLCQRRLGQPGNASPQTIPGHPPGTGWGSPAPDTGAAAPSPTAASARHSHSPGDTWS